MPLAFSQVYRISSHGDGGSTPSFIGLGTRLRVVPQGNALVPLVQFLVNSPYFEYKQFLGGKATDVGAGVVEVEDLRASGEGRYRFYRFEPLTMARWEEMASDIEGFATLRAAISSDDELQDFYREDYLQDWWQPKTGDTIEEALAFPPGTIRNWSDGYDHQKMPNGEWLRLGRTLRRLGDDEDDEEEDDEEDAVEPFKLVHTVAQGPWKEEAENLPASTARAYFEEDPNLAHLPDEYRRRPNAQRQRLHNSIMRKMRQDKIKGRKRVADDQRPVAVLTMGVPASGKSTAVGGVVAGGEFVHIDPDSIMEYLPEFQNAVAQRAKNGAAIVYEEAGYLGEQLRDETVARRMNLVFEGVGRDLEYYKDVIEQLKRNGYKIQLVMTHVEDADLAVERSNERGEKTGRWVPEDRVRSAVPIIPKNFVELSALVDDFAVFDSGSFPLKLAWGRQEGKEYVVDEDLRSRVKRAAGVEEAKAESPPDQPKAKPPAVGHNEIVKRFIRAWEADHAAISLLSRSYTKDQGLVYPVDDPRMRRTRYRL